MGWAVGDSYRHRRFVGYGVPCLCEHPDCKEQINRGLAYACGGDHDSERGCGLYFCYKHLIMSARLPQLCERCVKRRKPFPPKPDTEEWTNHLATDESWADWRAEQNAEA